MREALLNQLSAPGGGSPLRVASIATMHAGDIVAGTAHATEGGLYPIQHGVLDLLPRGPGRLSPAQWSNELPIVARFYEWPWRTHSLTLFSGEPLAFERERAIFDEMLGDVRGALWLDLAASTALYGRWLAPRLRATRGGVVSLDFAWPMLRQAQAKAQGEGHPNLSFVRARAERLPFADGTLDGVVCGGSLNEFGPRGVAAVLREVARALRPGGVGFFMHLLAAQQGRAALIQRTIVQPGGIGFWTREGIDQLFQGAGLEVEASLDIGLVGFTRVAKSGAT